MAEEGTILRGEHQVHVYYEDTDFSGFVYHANYLKFFERGREHLFGIDKIKEFFQKGLHFVVTHIDISYRKPARHGDVLMVHTECEMTGSPRVIFLQKVMRGGELLCEARVKTAALTTGGHVPTRLPDWVLTPRGPTK